MLARRLLPVALLAGLCLVVAGCGGGPKIVTVKGSVLKNGQPIELGPMGVLEVILVPDVPPGAEYTTYPAPRPEASGKFEIKEVPAGKYKVVVRQLDPYPANDVLKGAFEIATTKFIVDVDGTKTVDVDVGK